MVNKLVSKALRFESNYSTVVFPQAFHQNYCLGQAYTMSCQQNKYCNGASLENQFKIPSYFNKCRFVTCLE